MSKEYIEREAVIAKCNKLLDNANSCPDQSVLNGIQLVRDLILINKETRVQTADVEPVRHGRWYDEDSVDAHGSPIYRCSVCNKTVVDNYISCHKFCLHCGAHMDGGNTDE